MKRTTWEEPFAGRWVEPIRPDVEPLTPPRPSTGSRADSLAPLGGDEWRTPSIIKKARGALESEEDVFAAAALHFAEKQASEEPLKAQGKEVDLERLSGKVICCCDILEDPHRIELHLTDGTQLLVTAKTTREDSSFPWQTFYDKEPELKLNYALHNALRRIPGHSLEYHDKPCSRAKRILQFDKTWETSGEIRAKLLGIQLEGMRMSYIRCVADDGDLYDVVVREKVDLGDS